MQNLPLVSQVVLLYIPAISVDLLEARKVSQRKFCEMYTTPSMNAGVEESLVRIIGNQIFQQSLRITSEMHRGEFASQ